MSSAQASKKKKKSKKADNGVAASGAFGFGDDADFVVPDTTRSRPARRRSSSSDG